MPIRNAVAAEIMSKTWWNKTRRSANADIGITEEEAVVNEIIKQIQNVYCRFIKENWDEGDDFAYFNGNISQGYN